MKRLGTALVVLAAFHIPNHVEAQSGPLSAGTRIRVRAADVGVGSATGKATAALVGHLLGAGADSLWLRVDPPDGPLLAIDRATIRQLEVSAGQKRNAGKGALWGAGVGLGLGLLAVAALDDCMAGTQGWWIDPCEGDEDVLILGNVAAGAAWGALIGLLITSERWVTLPHTSLILGDAGDGVGLVLGVQHPL
jgi:hypothetical protein